MFCFNVCRFWKKSSISMQEFFFLKCQYKNPYNYWYYMPYLKNGSNYVENKKHRKRTKFNLNNVTKDMDFLLYVSI